MHDMLPPKGMSSESCALFKFWEINDKGVDPGICGHEPTDG